MEISAHRRFVLPRRKPVSATAPGERKSAGSALLRHTALWAASRGGERGGGPCGGIIVPNVGHGIVKTTGDIPSDEAPWPSPDMPLSRVHYLRRID
jgi:hypothetical protein